jgi:hypothetical protein
MAEALDVDPLWMLGYDVDNGETPSLQIPEERSETILLNNFRALSPDGRIKAIAYSHALLGLYPADVPSSAPVPQAPPVQTSATAPNAEEKFNPIAPGQLPDLSEKPALAGGDRFHLPHFGFRL